MFNQSMISSTDSLVSQKSIPELLIQVNDSADSLKLHQILEKAKSPGGPIQRLNTVKKMFDTLQRQCTSMSPSRGHRSKRGFFQD